MKKNAVIIFTRFPILGKVKTRLSKNIDKKIVLNIHKSMIKDTINICKSNDYDTLVFITDYDNLNCENISFFNNIKNIYPQGEYPFGKKMYNAFKNSFEMGYEKLILIGTDIPLLDEKIINDAINSLNNYECCINKTSDKGYYLIGLKDVKENFFDENIFKSENVFESTLNELQKEYKDIFIGKTLKDIDYKQDLDLFIKEDYNKSCYENLKQILKEEYIEK